jgi:hypothetical protein
MGRRSNDEHLTEIRVKDIERILKNKHAMKAVLTY